MRHRYGDHFHQFADLLLPRDADGPLPVAVLLHPGFWREQYSLDIADALARDLAARGWAAWNVEYRRGGGGRGGGVPAAPAGGGGPRALPPTPRPPRGAAR